MVRRQDRTPAESNKPPSKKRESRIPSRPGKNPARISEETFEPIQPKVFTSQHTETSALEETTEVSESTESSSGPEPNEARVPGLPGATETAASSPALKEAIPIYKSNPAPDYPAVARRRGYEGTVILDVLVNRSGRVADLRLFQSSGHASLDQTALSSVKGWVFDPARKGQETVEMWVRIPVCFRLREQGTP